MKIDAARLKDKGWSDHEIHHALNIFKKGEVHSELKKVEKKIYLTMLLMIIFAALYFYFSIT